ncbi:MAG: TraR/DksA C4-type zinc finger protein [Bacteroidia bacterium]
MSEQNKASDAGKEKTRYSDQELQEFKGLINKKLDKARNELNYLQDSIKNSNESNNEDAGVQNMMEEGTSTFEKEQQSQLAERQRKFIKNLEDALMRIENKTYGICQVTGKLISKERLRAVPHTTMSMEAKMSQKK